MKITEEYQESGRAIVSLLKADYVGDFVIQIYFSDGTERKVDFKNFLKSSYHPSIQKYLDEDRFKTYQIIDGNLTWGDYDMIFPLWDLYQGEIQ